MANTLALSSTSFTSFTINWNVTGGGSGYYYVVYRNTINSLTGATIVTPDPLTDTLYTGSASGSFTDSGLDANTSYYYFYRWFDDADGSLKGSVSYGPWTTTSSDAKQWNGSAFVSIKGVYKWNGSAFVQATNMYVNTVAGSSPTWKTLL